MTPILFPENETAFTSLGIGALADAVSARVSRVLNGKDELELTYPTSGVRYSDLKLDRIILAVPEYKKDAQPYRIYEITKPMRGLVKVYARHVSERKNFIPVMPFTASSITDTLNKLPQYVAETSPFTFWTDKSVVAPFSLDAPASLGSVLGGMAGSVLDTYGGEYEFDKYQIKLYNRRGLDRGVTIMYGKNLTKLEQMESLGSTITGVCPYWKSFDGAELVTLPEKVVESQYADSFAYRRTVTRDFSDLFTEQAPTVAQLRAAAQSYIAGSGIGQPEVSLSVAFEHLAQYKEYENIGLLETVNLGDTVHITYDKLEVQASARVVEVQFDVLREKYNVVRVGKVKASLVQTIQEISNSVADQTDYIASGTGAAITEATNKILGVNGGHVVTNRDANGEPYEILIMDTASTATARNVLRINMNGIGFSTTGYEGPFTTAWTIDGHFVADFIDTGTLTANLIKAGVLADEAGKFSLDLQTGEFQAEKLTSIVANTPVVNLLPSVYYSAVRYGNPWTITGITWTVNQDGTVTATGTATGSTNVHYYLMSDVASSQWNVPWIPVDPSKKYTISGGPGVSGCAIDIFRVDANGTLLSTHSTTTSYTEQAGASAIYIRLRVNSGTTLPSGGVTFKPMLEVGDTAHSYISAMNGAYAMESQIKQNAEEIELKVSDEDITGNYVIGRINLDSTTATIEAQHINLQGAVSISSLDSSLQKSVNGIPVVNILPSMYASEASSGKTFTSNGITWTVNNDGSVTAKGTATANSSIALCGNSATNIVPWVCLDETKLYTVSGAPGVTGCRIYTYFYNSSGTLIQSRYLETSQYITQQAGSSFVYVFLYVVSGTSIPSGVTFYPMLEVGNAAHAYVSTHNGSGALFQKTVTNATNINTNSQAISLEAQTRISDVGNLQSNLEAEIEIRSNQIESIVEDVRTLDGSITQKVSTAVSQSTSGLDARITSVKQTADDTAEIIDTHFEFSTEGMKIKGTEGSGESSYLKLAADRVGLWEDNNERLWLDENGANADTFNAVKAVSIGSFVWEEHPSGFRLIKK